MTASGIRNPLLEAIQRAFSLEELNTLCFDLQVPYDDLPGTGQEAKARELILYLQRRDRLSDLVAAVIQRRPHLAAELLRMPVAELRLPDGLGAGWWQQIRHAPRPVQAILALVAVIVLLLLGTGAYLGVRSGGAAQPLGAGCDACQAWRDLDPDRRLSRAARG